MARPPKKKAPRKKAGRAATPKRRAKAAKAKRAKAPAARPAGPAVVKVILHARGELVETALCEAYGFDRGRALFRLESVPFLHPKPTYGDVISAHTDDAYEGNWAWDRDREPIRHDGGRYTLMVDYHTSDEEADFDRLCRRLRADHDLVAELGYEPQGKKPGRLYLAAPRKSPPTAVLAALGQVGAGFRIEAVRPL
jgi:hypothetical protein